MAALELLVSRPDVRAAMGAAARELARREHDLDRVADLYVSAFEQSAGGTARLRRGAAGRERAGAEVGIEPGSDEERMIATRLGEVDLGG